MLQTRLEARGMLDWSDPIGWKLFTAGLLLRSEQSILKEYGGKKVKEGLWVFPKACLYAYRLLEAFPRMRVTDAAQGKLSSVWGFPSTLSKYSQPTPDWDSLYPSQQVAIDYLVSSTLRGSLLALPPRFGKCACAIIASRVLRMSRVLVICPLSVLQVWESECKKWGGIDATILRGKDVVPISPGWYITNYDTVVRHPVGYRTPWDLIVFDESILLKTRKTKRLSALKQVCKKAKKVWELSGLPITRVVSDLYTQFQLLEPLSFRSFWRFANSYCEVEETVWGKSIVGSKQSVDFRQVFKDLMFVRDKLDTMQYSQTTHENLDLEMTEEQSQVYQQVQDGLIEGLLSRSLSIPNRMAELTRLQQAVSGLSNFPDLRSYDSCKVDAVLEALEAQVWELPIIIWVHWKGTGHHLHGLIKDLGAYKSAYINGDTPEKMRGDWIKKYQEGNLDILILSPGVGKYGLTLNNTQTSVHLDRSFNMDDYVQSSYRVQGFDLDHVPHVVTLRCPGTVEELVEENLEGKAADISKVSDAELIKLLENLH
jgi:SNF2 family DNA or RNA helicase